jgi:peptide deformylase
MALKEVLMLGNPKLRENSKEIKDFGIGLERIRKDLKDTLSHLQKVERMGRALAAPQIGYPKQVIYMQIPKRRLLMVNPRVTWRSKELFWVWDSCFSFDLAFFVKIQRHKKIRVQYQDAEGNRKIEQFENDLSELIQHEIDHLRGILALDHSRDSRRVMMRGEWEKKFEKSNAGCE